MTHKLLLHIAREYTRRQFNAETRRATAAGIAHDKVLCWMGNALHKCDFEATEALTMLRSRIDSELQTMEESE